MLLKHAKTGQTCKVAKTGSKRGVAAAWIIRHRPLTAQDHSNDVTVRDMRGIRKAVVGLPAQPGCTIELVIMPIPALDVDHY